MLIRPIVGFRFRIKAILSIVLVVMAFLTAAKLSVTLPRRIFHLAQDIPTGHIDSVTQQGAWIFFIVLTCLIAHDYFRYS